ncbi:Ig-like domain-containing protein, partial [Enterococcus faecalis]|uniref:Ig-like domain-containing protein n=1 Tax=Enterococcus faecalis TaxID=1351 RepID=UPI001F5A0D62
GLTLAATALILNGSLMPINNVFANEQNKDSTAAVSNEEVQKTLESSVQLPTNESVANTEENTIPETTSSSNEQVSEEKTTPSEVTSQSDVQTSENQQESSISSVGTQDDTTRATNGRIPINTPIVSNTYLSNGNIQWDNWWLAFRQPKPDGDPRIVQSNVTNSWGNIVDQSTGTAEFPRTYIRKQSDRSILVGATNSTADKHAQIRTTFTLPVNRTYQIPVSSQSSNATAADIRVQYTEQIGTGVRFDTVYVTNSSGTLTFKPTQNLPLSMTYHTYIMANQTSTFTFGNIVMKYATQWNQVDDLFGNQQHTSLASGINGATIQAAIQMAQKLPASNEDKQDILSEANKAWNLYQIKNTVLDNSLTTDSTNATGTGEPGGTVIIRKEDGTELGRGTVDSNGHYS